MFKIFLVEDDRLYSRMLQHTLGLNPEHEVSVFTNGQACQEQLHKQPDMVLLDYYLPDVNGNVMLKRILKKCPDCEVVIISGQEQVAIALELLREGAYDYILKDNDAKERLLATIQNIKRQQRLKRENKRLKTVLKEQHVLLGKSPAMQEVKRLIERTGPSEISVILSGESGTGKEVAARIIHEKSMRKDGPFVGINMAAIPENLVESELFGHEKGAFTGATTRRIGKLELANKGTLFLDEVGDMPKPIQAKLLRVLQEKKISRLGGNDELSIDIRVVSATNQNLIKMVEEDNFREDLYFRLFGLNIELPPLRERDKDIELLANFFLQQLADSQQAVPKKLSKQATIKLNKHNWTGNVRELRATIELAFTLSSSSDINPEDLKLHQISKSQSTDNFWDEERTLKEYQLLIVNHYLNKHEGNVLKVADVLGVGKSTIYRMLERHEDLRN